MTRTSERLTPWRDVEIGEARTLPADWYTSKALFDLEQEKLFPNVWQYVGREAELPEPNTHFTCELGSEPLIITRDGEGELHVLSNVCRHRGAPVSRGCGRGRALRCLYHGWTYNLDGSLRRAKGMDNTPSFNPDEIGLPSYRVETWKGQIWATLGGEEIPSLAEWLAPVTETATNYRVEDLEYVGGRSWQVPSNWKLYVDNYMEGYHVPFVHPGLLQATTVDPKIVLSEWSNQQWGGEPYPRGPGSRVAGLLGSVAEFRKMKPAMPGLEDTESNGYYLHWVFPNHTFNFMPDGFMLMRVIPVGPELTRSEFHWWLPKAESLEEKMLQAAVVNFGHVINMEDAEICSYAQKGMRSGDYVQGAYNVDDEQNLHHFHGILNRYMQPLIEEAFDV